MDATRVNPGLSITAVHFRQPDRLSSVAFQLESHREPNTDECDGSVAHDESFLVGDPSTQVIARRFHVLVLLMRHEFMREAHQRMSATVPRMG